MYVQCTIYKTGRNIWHYIENMQGCFTYGTSLASQAKNIPKCSIPDE